MKRIIKGIFQTSKDVIALVIIATWCVAIFLPEHLVDEVTQRSFERIIMMVIGFYFGSKVEKPVTDTEVKPLCPYLESVKEEIEDRK